MKAHVAIENGEWQAHPPTAVSKAIHWLQNYISENPYTDAAKEARNIFGLGAVRDRPVLDELLALIGQIRKKRSRPGGNKQNKNRDEPNKCRSQHSRLTVQA